jgi:5-(carboxyamino)imidazole ribonucleotide mutase
MTQPLVGVIMGSSSDWEVMKHACDTLQELGVECETRVVSAHRTPDAATEYARTAAERGLRLVIAGAGGAAHLAGVMAGNTHLPVLGVPMQTSALGGMDSLLSTVQMPAGIPVGTLAIGKAGATNAALLAVAILALSDAELSARSWRSARPRRARSWSIPTLGRVAPQEHFSSRQAADVDSHGVPDVPGLHDAQLRGRRCRQVPVHVVLR